jgi:hypothetical protein
LNLTSANSTQNLIWPDGSIKGLDLSAGPALVVRNYTADANGNPAHIPIKVHTGMNMGTSGTLQIVLDGNAWGSTISFDPGVPVNLGGTLDVTLAPGVTPASMWGRPVKLFDWTGVTPTGRFTWQDDMGIPYWTIPQNSIQPAWELAPQPEPFFYVWDTSHLYDTGTVTLYLNADTNRDGTLNSLDIDAIYQHMTVAPSTYQGAWPRALAAYNSQYDLNGDGVVNQDDVTYELYHYFLTGYGDADLNKAIDFQDFQILLNHWQNTGPGVGWTQADLNGDGVVDFMDSQIILNYWNPTGWNIAPSEETPEPATLTLLALGALGLVRRKRRPWPVARKP